MNTREKIRNKALEMFNERGIEYVGLRELAALLEMRVSNITYYFPTKDDLVFALAQELGEKNSSVLVARPSLTMQEFLEMMQQVFVHHQEYRCLLLSFVHLMQQNTRMAQAYKKTGATRTNTLRQNLAALVTNGYLKANEETLAVLTATLSLISRFWISEAVISFLTMKKEAQVQHAMTMLTHLLLPHTTAKGSREISAFL